jgi:predicted ester cyclase
MGLFGRRKGEQSNKAAKETNSPKKTIPSVVGVELPSAPPPPQTVIRIVGDSKHVTTIEKDEQGRDVRQTIIMKLTPAELQQFGVTTTKKNSVKSTNSSSQRTPPPPSRSPVAAAQSPVVTATETIPAPESSSSSSSHRHHQAAIETTRELVKGFIADIWNRGDIDLIKTICHPSLRFNGHVGMDRVGHEGFARMVTTVREALADYHCEIHSMVVESNKAFCRLKFTGKHTGVLLGYPPTGKPVAWVGASEFTCKNGKILKVWELGDVKSLEAQLRSSEV